MAQSCFCRFLSLPVILYTAERTDARCNGTGRRMCVLFLSEVQNNSIYLTHIPSIPGNKIKPPRYQPATRRYLLATCILCLAQSFPTISSEIPYLPADRPHFFPGKMGPKLGLRLIRGYKRFDTSLICTRTHGSTVNWRFNVRFKLFLTYNTYN